MSWFNIPWVFGLIGLSGIAGMIGSFVIYLGLIKATGSRVRNVLDREWFYAGFLTGVAERFFFTAAIGLTSVDGNFSSIVSAIVGWIAIKGQAHYRMFSDPQNIDIPKVYLGVLGSLASLLFAIAGGFAWTRHWTLGRFLMFLGLG